MEAATPPPPATPAKAKEPEPAFFVEPKKEEAAAPPTPDAEPELDIPDDPVPENFKKLRTKTRETLKTLREATAAKAKLEQDLEDYKSGKVVPEVLQQKENEIARLAPYEKLHNLKASTEYQEKFVKPLTQNETQLKSVLKDYGIPEEMTDRLLTSNRAEINSFLSDHSVDELGAAEVRDLVFKINTTRSQALEAEKEPAKVLESLKVESAAIMQAKENDRRQKVATTARDSWAETLLQIRSERSIPELIRKDNDEAFNKQYVDPILSKASEEYGRLITELGLSGATLKPDVARALAKMTLLAHATGVALHTRDAAVNEINQLTQNSARTQNLVRPQIGGGNGAGVPSPAPSKEVSPEADARALMQSILSRKPT